MSTWTKIRFDECAQLSKGMSYGSEDYCDDGEGTPFVTLKCVAKGGGFSRRGLKYIQGSVPEAFRLYPGDLALANTDITRDADVVGSPLCVPNDMGFPHVGMSMDLSRIDFVNDRIIRGLFFLCLMMPEARKFMRANSSGSTVLHLKTGSVPELEFFVPVDRKEQAKIVEVLAKLDRGIEQTEALLAKQQRIKTGLMYDLFTRGLDAQGRLRHPSTHRFKNTVLGSVPVEWDETDIGTLAMLVTSGPRGWARYYSDAGARFIRIGNLTRDHVNFRFQDMQFVSPPDGAEGNRTQLIHGDVLFSITADLGIVGLVPPGLGPAYINQHIALIRPKTTGVVSGWLANFLASHRIQQWISNINESGAKAGLNLPTIKGMPVTAPKPTEQRMIADILTLCDRQIADTSAQVLKLRRQKAGLMLDLLSGSVSVTPLLANSKVLVSS